MQRKEFLKLGFSALGAATILPRISSCIKDTSNTGGNTGIDGACTAAPTETEGPFPTHTPAAYAITDIRSDRKGVDLTANITIQNVNASCAALAGAIVDIWHCDAEGNYSEYGGGGMQNTNYTSVHFLRGRQTSNAKGVVTFLTKFPGWYNGRATHIHVHVYNAAGKSLLITQIAFPEATDSAVVAVNATSPYKAVSNAYTYNKNDNVFSDGTANEMSTIAGSIAAGYTLTHTVKVSA
jgi:protocatechuate 3,4-dioxygenase beta subunit